ncbi:MAG: type I-E CRISPR-associated protein Cas6/Cse3/CasE [Proteobacteria bacterium]|nr:type I-E CRISPR-associated protein Cas6/Cse3/CasE [Pseudomonadota bacterium]MBU1698082.1 type I-E CRISPR-associated protein Cas6/Cse3/CasE [Pseudomonadota bacterium]
MTNLLKLTLGYDQLAREKIYDNYAWHKKAWTLFEHHRELKERNVGTEKERGPAPFLSRYIQKSDHVQLLIVSEYFPLKPDWCGSDQWKLIEIDETYLSQENYYFDLYANPTRSVKKPDGMGGFTKHGRRLTLMDKPSQTDWLLRKGKNHGFKLDDDIPLKIEKPVNHYFNRKGRKGLHIGVRFQGAFHVTYQKAFQKAFREGIGTAKGFGFGLLMIKPA